MDIEIFLREIDDHLFRKSFKKNESNLVSLIRRFNFDQFIQYNDYVVKYLENELND